LNSETFEQQYQTAKKFLTQLENDPQRAQDRSNWLDGARNFRRIHVAQKSQKLGPPSLFMSAKMYRRMYDRFNIPIDLEQAVEQYSEVAKLYPGHSLADDALFNASAGLFLESGKEQQAIGLLEKIVTVYPKSDHYELARDRLNKQTKKIPSSNLSNNVTKAEVPQTLARIFPVKYWSSTDYTRIVIQASFPVKFTSSLLEKEGDQPRRVYVDFSSSSISPQYSNPVQIQDGLLKQVRSGQFSNDTVRVVLDIESLSEYNIFSLTDPFRVIIDVHGISKNREIAGMVATKEAISSPPAPAKIKELSSMSQNDMEKAIIYLEEQKKRDPNGDWSTGRISKNKISLAQQLGLGIQKIVVDPGHGGKDPGAMAFGLKEKDIVLKISKKIAKVLKTTYHYDIALTRTRDVYIPLEERTAIANTQNGDLFVSIHVNAHPDKTIGGIETYFLNLATDADAMRVAALENATSSHNINELQDILSNLMKNSKIDESSRLAQFVQTNLVSGLQQQYKTHDLGVKQAPFYVLIGAEMPAILAEISFITNPQEAKLLQDEKYLLKIAEQIAAGIAAYVDHHHTAAVRF
jgi:N-acetylmuramoyl-L-alanine amidase